MLAVKYILLLIATFNCALADEYTGEDHAEDIEEPNVEEFYVADEMNDICEKNVINLLVLLNMRPFFSDDELFTARRRGKQKQLSYWTSFACFCL